MADYFTMPADKGYFDFGDVAFRAKDKDVRVDVDMLTGLITMDGPIDVFFKNDEVRKQFLEWLPMAWDEVRKEAASC